MGPCPVCGVKYPDSVRVCVACGVDLETGRRLVPPPPVREDDAAPRGNQARPGLLGLYDWTRALLPGAFRPATLVVCLATVAVSLVTLYIGLVVLFLGAWIAGFLIGGLAVLMYWQALVWLQTGRFVLLQNGLIEYNRIQWLVFAIGVVTPPTIFLALLATYRPEL